MRAPSLRDVADAHPELALGLPALPQQGGLGLFVVTSEGRFWGRQWSVGDVVVCRGEARSGDPTVLVARGHGRPRLGSVRGARVWGDAGEPCHSGRWRVAGRLAAVYHHTPHGWVVDLMDNELAVSTADCGEQSAAQAPFRQPQLSLFAA